MSKKAKLELGAEARLFNSDIGYTSTGFSFNELGVLRPTPSTNFDYTRDIYSAYVTYGKQFEKWSYQLGARAENVTVDATALVSEVLTTDTENITFENDYFEI